MADGNAFEKLHVEPTKKSDLDGLLEHFNLPPKAVKFIRKNKKAIISAIVIAVVVALSLSVYDVFRKKKINNSSTSLAIAMKTPESSRQSALQKVVEDYSGTDSARWARVGLAHIDLKNGKFKAAAEQYSKIKEEISPSDPLYGLVSFGMAQAQEAGKEYDSALGGYQALAKMDGYRGIGLLGMARIYEMKGESDKALSTYEQYMATLEGENPNDPERAFVAEKIGRLKVKP
jgi:predicted negative regulator of RcsB-dependent stress response